MLYLERPVLDDTNGRSPGAIVAVWVVAVWLVVFGARAVWLASTEFFGVGELNPLLAPLCTGFTAAWIFVLNRGGSGPVPASTQHLVDKVALVTTVGLSLVEVVVLTPGERGSSTTAPCGRP